MKTIEEFSSQKKLQKKIQKKWENILFPMIGGVFNRTISEDIITVRPLPLPPPTMDPIIFGTGAELPNPRPFLVPWYEHYLPELKTNENLIIWEQKNIFNTNGIKS